MAKTKFTKVAKEPQIPLASSTKSKFLKRYKELYLKEASSDIADEDLVLAVHSKDYPELISGDKKSQGSEEASQPNPNDQKGEEPKKTADDKNTEEKNDEFTEEEIVEYKKKYFDLFGTKALEDVEFIEIKNAVDAKEEALNNATKVEVEEVKTEIELKEGEILAVNKKTKEKRVFNKLTFSLLKNDWKEVAVKPKEIQ